MTAANLDLLDAEWFARYARSVDELTGRLDAISIEATAEACHRGHDRDRGFFSTKAWIKHHVQLTGPDAHGRIQTMRMFDLLPTWAAAARSGEVGVAQTRLMARVAANPRVHVGLLGVPTEGGCHHRPRCLPGGATGSRKIRKKSPENYTNTYHGAFL